ncbi:Ig-like domain-containing protein (plasmid) [Pseudocitrobacter faecalis]|nr:Ig-like domain-containing protein [Pseudocitrobacter faecalis]
MTITPDSTTVEAGKTVALTSTVLPENATNQESDLGLEEH